MTCHQRVARQCVHVTMAEYIPLGFCIVYIPLTYHWLMVPKVGCAFLPIFPFRVSGHLSNHSLEMPFREWAFLQTMQLFLRNIINVANLLVYTLSHHYENIWIVVARNQEREGQLLPLCLYVDFQEKPVIWNTDPAHSYSRLQKIILCSILFQLFGSTHFVSHKVWGLDMWELVPSRLMEGNQIVFSSFLDAEYLFINEDKHTMLST